jgi:hypothetical protein
MYANCSQDLALIVEGKINWGQLHDGIFNKKIILNNIELLKVGNINFKFCCCNLTNRFLMINFFFLVVFVGFCLSCRRENLLGKADQLGNLILLIFSWNFL